MASVFSTIYANIQSAITELTSTSLTAIFYKLAQSIAITIDQTNDEITNTTSVITDIVANKNFGKSQYYVDSALYYQEGDTLTTDPISLKPIYATIDTTKNLIKKAAFQNLSSGNAQFLTLKVVKLDTGTGKYAQLTTPELTDFTTYFLNFQLPGLPFTIISEAANLFKFDAKVTYYSTYDLATLKAAIEAAMVVFRDSLDLNGVLYVNDLESYLKSNVEGIRNVYLTNTKLDNVTMVGYAGLAAGYFDYDPTIDVDLFTYEPI